MRNDGECSQRFQRLADLFRQSEWRQETDSPRQSEQDDRESNQPSYWRTGRMCGFSGHSESSDGTVWLGEIGAALHAKLVNAGLVEPRQKTEQDTSAESEKITLRQFLSEHMEHGRTAKGDKAAPATVVKWRPTETFLNEFFPGKLLDDVTAEDAHQFRVWLDKRRINRRQPDARANR